MRKALLALIACLIAVIAYASPGSPYLSYGWRPTAGATNITQNGTETVIALANGTSLGPSSAISTLAGDLVMVGVQCRSGTTPTGMAVSGSTLGAFTGSISAGTSLYSQMFYKYDSTGRSGETISVSWTGTTNCRASITVWTGAKDPSTLTLGTDYNTGSATGGSGGTTSNVTFTTKGNNSKLVGLSTVWTSGDTQTADANTTILSQDGGAGDMASIISVGYTNAGSNEIGTTTAADNGGYAVVAFEMVHK